MKRSQELSRLISLAKIARQKVEALSYVENGPPHLQGYCGIASKYLQVLANREGINPQFVVGHFRSFYRPLGIYRWHAGHSWIEHENHIIDITATQFKNVSTKIERNFNIKVYVSVSTNPHYYEEHSNEEALRIVRNWYFEPMEEICNRLEEALS